MSLPIPEGKQKEVLGLPDSGHYVVLGSAGSGKTTLAIYRAIYLSKLIEPRFKVLLVTFNKSLVTYLEAISEGNLQSIDVRNYHHFARGYLGHRGVLGWNDIVPSMNFYNENKKLTYIRKAIEEIIEICGKNSTLSRAPEVFHEETCWIQKMGIVSLVEYLNTGRVGRSDTRINRDKKKYFYAVYEKYLEIRARDDYHYDWDDLAITVREKLEEDDDERKYKHIVIDEGQDLSPVMLQSLAHAIPEDGSLTLFGDVAQQIYGGRISWRYAGLQVDKNHIWRFDQNYRNSKEIAELAQAISNSPCFKRSADLVVPKKPKASGPKPVLLEFNSELTELKWIVEKLPTIAENESVAILVRTRASVKKIKRRLIKNGIGFQELDRDLQRWNGGHGISIGTFHSAKGLEFDAVIVPYCSTSRIPDIEKITALDDRDEAISEDAKLIYVAVTRARRRVILSYSGNLTEVIPREDRYFDIREGK